MQEADGLFPLHLHGWSSLEAQVAAIADDIAYDNHDIDDGIRAGLLNLEQLLEVPFVRKSWNGVKARYPDLPDERLMPELIRDQTGLMVNDVIETTRGNIAEAGIETVEDVRAAGRMLGGFSPEIGREHVCTPVTNEHLV